MPRTTRLWEYFQRIGKDDKAVCNYCNKILSYRGTSNNLKKHLKMVHFQTYLKLINSPPLKTAAQKKKEVELEQQFKEEVSDEAPEQDEENSDPEQIIEYVLEEEPELSEQQRAEEKKRKLHTRLETWRKFRHQLNNKRKIRIHLEKQRKVRLQSKKDNEQATVGCSNSTFGSIAQRVFEKDDEFEYFGGYIAAGLRCLTVKSCIKAEDEIQAVLSKYRLMDLESDNKNVNHE